MPPTDPDLDHYRDWAMVALMKERHLLAFVHKSVDEYYENVPGGFQDEDDNARFAIEAIDAVMTTRDAPPGSLAYQLAHDHGLCAACEDFWYIFTDSQKESLEQRFTKGERTFAQPATRFLEAVGDMIVTYYHELMDTSNNRGWPMEDSTQYAQRALAEYKKEEAERGW